MNFEKIVEYLLAPSSYDDGCTAVEHFETHISHVFLSANFAWKVKKPIKLPFLDFSTLERRKYFCQREVELNSRFADKLYIGVVPIVIDGAGFRILPPDKLHEKGAVEYAVKMHRFQEEDLFLNRLSRGILSHSDVCATAQVISRFHNSAQRSPDFGSPEIILKECRENFVTCRESVPEGVEQIILDKVQEATESAFQKNRERISNRQSKFVRHLHGDLHLKNICFFEGEVTLFDGIEFNEEFSCCDVWSDFAFLLMDLHYRGHPELAATALNTYLEELDDFDGLPLLPLFLAYRAAVRAKVSCLQYQQGGTDRECERLKESVLRHLGLADQVLRRRQQFCLVVGGFSGAGKTTLARELAARTGAVHIRTDVVRKHLAGVPLGQKAPESAYSLEVSKRTYRELFPRADSALESGLSVILDGVFGEDEPRREVERFAHERKLPLLPVWCDVEDAVAEARLLARTGDASDADMTVRAHQKSRKTEPREWKWILTSSPVQEVASQVENLLVLKLDEKHSWGSTTASSKP